MDLIINFLTDSVREIGVGYVATCLSLATAGIWYLLRERKYHGWTLNVTDNKGEVIDLTDPFTGKAFILEPAKIKLWLSGAGLALEQDIKSKLSAFAWLNCLPLSGKAKELEMTSVDFKAKRISVDIRKNPEKKK